MYDVRYGHRADPRSARDERLIRLGRFNDRVAEVDLDIEAFGLAVLMARYAEPNGSLQITYDELMAATRIQSRPTLNKALAALVTADLIRATGNHRNRVYHIQWTVGTLHVIEGGA